eukprot:235122-Prymnesium_polylepis.1
MPSPRPAILLPLCRVAACAAQRSPICSVPPIPVLAALRACAIFSQTCASRARGARLAAA